MIPTSRFLMNPPPAPADAASAATPFWKKLFAAGAFEWAFRMRGGDARSFFAPQDQSGKLLAEKNAWLDQSPERYVAVTDAGAPLVPQLWNMAEEWGHASPSDDQAHDLVALARVWEPDVLLMDSSTMNVVAGAVCMPSSWILQHAIGKPVHAVHDMVPQLNPQIGDKIDRFLRQLPPGKAFRRENWSFTRSAEYNYHPALQRAKLDETVTIGEIHLRVEQQLFCAIPGAVLMGIRIERCPLTDLAGDPEVWSHVALKIRTMPDDVADYKSMLSAREPMVAAMERYQKTL